MVNKYDIPELDEREILKDIIIHNFSFGDLDKKYEGLTEATGNIFCPFHDNYDTPAAKAYYDDTLDIVIIYCFKERRKFTSYDYVDKILCQKKNVYQNPREFVELNIPEKKLRESVAIIKQSLVTENATLAEQRIEYINNVYNKYDNVIDFIDSLYNELD